MIKKLVDKMWDELNDSEKYIRCAMNKKEEHPVMAEKYYNLSLQEMAHFNVLHDMATEYINEEKAKGVEPSIEEMAIYNYEHKKAMEYATEIKIQQEIFKK